MLLLWLATVSQAEDVVSCLLNIRQSLTGQSERLVQSRMSSKIMSNYIPMCVDTSIRACSMYLTCHILIYNISSDVFSCPHTLTTKHEFKCNNHDQ